MKARLASIKWLNSLEEIFIGLMLLAITAVIFINVVLRYVFRSGWSWAEEFSRYGVIWLTFIGASVCIYRGLHIAVDLFGGKLSKHLDRRWTAVVNFVCVLFSLTFFWYSLQLVLKVWQLNQRTIALGMPMWVVYGAMPVGALLMALRFSQEILGGLGGDSGGSDAAAPTHENSETPS